mgnify:CR=1 FL=1
MKTKEITMLSLIFTVYLLPEVLPPPLDGLIAFVAPYMSAFIAFVLLGNFKIALLCSLPTTVRGYEVLIKSYPLIIDYHSQISATFNRLFGFQEMPPGFILLYLLVGMPVLSILEVFLAKSTVEKLKLKERVGYA